MIRRDFGSVNLNQMPVSGYEIEPQNFPAEDYGQPYFTPSSQAIDHALKKYITVDEVTQLLEVSQQSRVGEVQLGNKNLPAFNKKQEIIDARDDNQVIVVGGPTGSGKSTQLPQFLLQAGAERIWHTQPRRPAAHNVSQRIGDELAEAYDDPEARNLVAEHTAVVNTVTPDTKITVMSDGLAVVLKLVESLEDDDEPLDIIIDEFHEFNENAEILFGYLMSTIDKKPNIKVFVMSATMDSARISNFVSQTGKPVPPIIEIEGRTHPIEHLEKPDSTSLQEALYYASELEPGAVAQVFTSGKQEIKDLVDGISRQLPKTGPTKYKVAPLHAKLSNKDQAEAFDPFDGAKIVVGTNVMETSITIPNTRVVIDGGNERRQEIDEEGTEGLFEGPVSQDNCDQRAGRTGRDCPGTYVLTRHSEKYTYVPYIDRPKHSVPEILRKNVDRMMLRVAAAGILLEELPLLHPISHGALSRAAQALTAIDARDEDGAITTTGLHMNEFPVRTSSSRMMVEAMRYSPETRSYVAAVVSAIEVGGLPYYAPEVGKGWKGLTDEKNSDHLMQLDLFIASQNMDDKELAEVDLDVRNVARARETYAKVVRRSQGIWDKLKPPTMQERDDIKTCVFAGLINNVYQYMGDDEYERVGGWNHTTREIGNRSVISHKPSLLVGVPRTVERHIAGANVLTPIIENATAVDTPARLAQVAMPDFCNWEDDRLVLRKDEFRQVQQQTFNGLNLGVEREVPAPASPELRSKIINYAFSSPGKSLKSLLSIKHQLEKMQHLTTQQVPQLTHDSLIDMVEEATPVGAASPSLVENNLRQMIESKNLSINTYLDQAVIDDIKTSSPESIKIGSSQRHVTYKSGKAIVKKYSISDILESGFDDIRLADGRVVYFIYNKKEKPASTLIKDYYADGLSTD